MYKALQKNTTWWHTKTLLLLLSLQAQDVSAIRWETTLPQLSNPSWWVSRNVLKGVFNTKGFSLVQSSILVQETKLCRKPLRICNPLSLFQKALGSDPSLASAFSHPL